MAWIDGTYCNDAIGGAQVYALGLTTSSGGSTTTSRFTQYELLARSRVIAVLQYAGYPAPGATLTTPTDADDPVNVTNAFLRQVCASVMFNEIYSNIPGISLPEKTLNSIAIGVSMSDAVYNKKLPVPGLSATPIDGYGGNQFNTAPQLYPPITTTPKFTVLRRSGF